MASRLRYNGLKGTLGASLSSGDTSITFAAALTHSNGTSVPTLAGGDYIPLAILDASGNLTEIVYLTAYTAGATTGTISRGEEATSGASHASGDFFANTPTVEDWDEALAGGGGSSSSDLLYAPQAGIVSIDEFNDGVIDSDWVRVDESGGSGRVAWTELGEKMSLALLGGDASQELHALMYPLAASMVVGDAVITRVTYCQIGSSGFGTAYTMSGLILADGVTYGAGSQVVAFPYPSWYVFSNYSNYNSWGVAQNGSAWDGKAPMWIRIVKLASNVWRLDVSPDGISWMKNFSTTTNSFTPTHVGMLGSSWGTGTLGVVDFDFIRLESGVS